MKVRMQNKMCEEGFIFENVLGSSKCFGDIYFFFHVGSRSDSRKFLIPQVCSGLYSGKYTFRMNYVINMKIFPHSPVCLHTFQFQQCSCKKSQLINVITSSTEFGLVELKITWTWSFGGCLGSNFHTWCELLKIHRMRTEDTCHQQSQRKIWCHRTSEDYEIRQEKGPFL